MRKTLIAIVVLSVALAAVCGCFAAVWRGLGESVLSSMTPTVDFENATVEDIAADGFSVPEGAYEIYIKDRTSMDVRTTWLRFSLPSAERAVLEAQIEGEGLSRTSGSTPPAFWPTFSMFEDFMIPTWWQPGPHAEVYIRTTPFSDESSHTRGVMVVFEEDRVYQWRWSFQWWMLDEAVDTASQ